MIKIEQAQPRSRTPDCLAACIASILEIPLADVPAPIPEDFARNSFDRYRDRLNKKVLKPLGFELLGVGNTDWVPLGYAVMNGGVPGLEDSPVSSHHSVVTLNGKIIWDPGPGQPCLNGMQLRPPFSWWILVSLDPAKQKRNLHLLPRRERRHARKDHFGQKLALRIGSSPSPRPRSGRGKCLLKG